MPTTHLTQIITDLNQWLPAMREAARITTQAIRYTHAHTTGLQADSQPERSAFAADRLHRELNTLTEIASILTDASMGGASFKTVLTVLADHALTLAAWPDLREAIVAPETEPSDHLCPACGVARLGWVSVQKMYRCPACEYAGTVEHVVNLRRWVITQSDMWLTREQAAEAFGLSRQGLRQHIARGNLNPSPEGLLCTAELRALPRRGESLP